MKLKMSSQCLATTGKFVFLISPKSNFGLVQRSKISWKCHANPRNNAFSTTTKSHFGMVKGRKWVQSDMRALETSLSRLHPFRILGWSGGKIICSQCLATTWNIAFSTSTKSNFGLVKRQKMTFKGIQIFYFVCVCVCVCVCGCVMTYRSIGFISRQ